METWALIQEDLLSLLFYDIDPTLFVSLGFVIIITKGIIYLWPEVEKFSLPLHLTGLSIIIILTGLSTSIVAGKGYDCPYFVYVTNMVETQALPIIQHTDKPLTYLVMYSIGKLLDVTGRLSVPYSGIFFACLFVVSTFVLGYSLTRDYTVSLGASLIVMQSNFMENLALNFIGNLFGLCLLYLGFSAYNEKKHRISIPIFILLYFAHRFTFAIGIFTIIIHQLSNLKRDKRLIQYIIFVALAGISFLIIGSFNRVYLAELILDSLRGGTILKVSFYDFLQHNWLNEWFLIYFLYALGMIAILSEKSKFMIVWLCSIFTTILIFPIYSGRVLLYLPFPFLGILGLKWIVDYIPRPSIRTFVYVSICLLFMYSTTNYYNENKITNLRYSERGPFVWDTVFVEELQLIWISENYDLSEIIVISDIDIGNEGIVKTWTTHPHLKPGVHYRLIAEIGTNVFLGKLSELLESGYHKAAGYSYAEWTGYPIFGPQTISLEGKTLIIPDTLYNIDESEMDLLEESDYPGVYLVKEAVYS